MLRINLATSLGSSLVGSLYILDEPSIGLHSRDTERLIKVLKQLRDLGNTVIVVEHDEEIIRAADWLIDIGPEAGRLGGEIVYEGPPPGEQSGATPTLPREGFKSYTLAFLSHSETIPLPKSRRRSSSYIEVKGARANNLKGIDVRFPLGVMTCVTGVSGSGKSSLVRDIFYNAMKRQLDEVADRPGEFLSLGGDTKMVSAIEFVDQNPIGKSTRSNPVTYVKAWDEIRKLFAAQPLSRQMGYTSAYFSFNTDGGRCEECKGEGTVTIEMQFMADLVLPCESCHGQRFKSEILDVRFHDKNVCDVLDMTINQAIEFFSEYKEWHCSNPCRTWVWATSSSGSRHRRSRVVRINVSSLPTTWGWRNTSPRSLSSTNPLRVSTFTTSASCLLLLTPSLPGVIPSSSSSIIWRSSSVPTTSLTLVPKAVMKAETLSPWELPTRLQSARTAIQPNSCVRN